MGCPKLTYELKKTTVLRTVWNVAENSKKRVRLYDYGARFYDAARGQWTTKDPLAEKYPEWSPYVFAFDNPIKYNDPTGMSPEEGNQVGSINYNSKDKTFTISETNTHVTDQKTNSTSNDDGTTTTTTTTSYTQTSSTTTINENGDIVSSKSLTTKREETMNKTTDKYGNQVGPGNGIDKVVGQYKGGKVGAFANTAAFSLANYKEFPINQDVAIYQEMDQAFSKADQRNNSYSDLGLQVLYNLKGLNQYNVSKNNLSKQGFKKDNIYNYYRREVKNNY